MPRDLEFGNLEGKAEREVVLAIRKLRDAVNVTGQVVNAIPPQMSANQILDLVRSNLQSNGSHPLNLTGLAFNSGAGTLTTGTHAQRRTTAPTSGSFFYETDRVALYGATANAWIVLASLFSSSSADLPSDLTPNDIGFLFYQQDTGTGNMVLSWSGNAWRYIVGWMLGTFAARPAAFFPDDPRAGIYYYATDIEQLFWNDGFGAWVRWLPTPPWACNVYNSGAQSIATGATTLLTFDTETADVGSLHSTSVNTGRITIPTGGGGNPSNWHILGSVRWENNATGYRLVRLLKNGATSCALSVVAPATGQVTIQQVSFIDINPADGDYYELYVIQNSGGALNAESDASGTFFEAHKVV